MFEKYTPVFMEKPVIVFNNDGQLNEYIRLWKPYLFLHHFAVSGSLAKEVKMDDSDDLLAGKNSFQIVLGTANIELLDMRGYTQKQIDEHMVTCSQELTLIHELLHCKMNFMAPPYTLEGKYYDVMGHRDLELMARTIFMCAYHLPNDWWDNSFSGSKWRYNDDKSDTADTESKG